MEAGCEYKLNTIVLFDNAALDIVKDETQRTKDRVLSQFMTIAQHAVSQQAFSLRVSSGLHLPTDF